MMATMSYLDVKQAFDRMLDQIVTTATPIQFEFKGKKLAIALVAPEGKLARLEPHPDCLVGDPEDIVHVDWSGEVHHDLPFRPVAPGQWDTRKPEAVRSSRYAGDFTEGVGVEHYTMNGRRNIWQHY